MADDTLAVQAAVVARLRADAALAALVGPRIYDQPEPAAAFPYVSTGPVVAQPFEAQAVDGWEMSLTLDSWSRAEGAPELRRIMAAAYACLHAAPLSIAGRHVVMVRLTDQRDVSMRGDGIRHGIQRFEIFTHS